MFNVLQEIRAMAGPKIAERRDENEESMKWREPNVLFFLSLLTPQLAIEAKWPHIRLGPMINLDTHHDEKFLNDPIPLYDVRKYQLNLYELLEELD